MKWFLRCLVPTRLTTQNGFSYFPNHQFRAGRFFDINKAGVSWTLVFPGHCVHVLESPPQSSHSRDEHQVQSWPSLCKLESKGCESRGDLTYKWKVRSQIRESSNLGTQWYMSVNKALGDRKTWSWGQPGLQRENLDRVRIQGRGEGRGRRLGEEERGESHVHWSTISNQSTEVYLDKHMNDMQ